MLDVFDLVFDSKDPNIGKARLLRALMELAREKPFGKITIHDICEKARVSRQTFYRHFENKQTAVQWYWHVIASKYLLRVGRDLSWRESFVKNFEIAEAYHGFFAKALSDDGLESLRAFGYRSRVESLKDTIVNYLGLELTEELEFQIDFFAEAEPRIIEKYLFKKRFMNPDHVADLLVSCVPRQLYDLLNRE